MQHLLIVLIGYVVIEIVFYFTHLSPLSEIEIQQLSKKRRFIYIKSKYRFKKVESMPNKNFKSSLKPGGRFYNVDLFLYEFPSFASNLLKGKKHEWVVFSYVKNDKVICFYSNKGDDNLSVSPTISPERIIDFGIENKCESIIRFHNHPNGLSSKYSYLGASEQDLVSAKYFSAIANNDGMNWLDFVCERGNFLLFYESYSREFTPENAKFEHIRMQNCLSEFSNYKLHRELGILRLFKYDV